MSDQNPYSSNPYPDTTGGQQFPQYGAPGAPPTQNYGGAPVYQQPAYAQAVGTNGLAIASLICGILGTSLVAVILGHIALSQIKKTGQEGRGMAIAGLVLGYLALVVSVIAVIFLLVATSQLGSSTYYE